MSENTSLTFKKREDVEWSTVPYIKIPLSGTDQDAEWQYHLQQMVVADDPVKYLGDNLDKTT